jgi:ubiquinone/menaquinone biosynthesis C-methylase UbiE
VLEVGCGSGQGTELLADAGAVKVDGIDISQRSIEHARKTLARDFLSFHMLTGDTLPFEDASYDIVVSLETIEHVVDVDVFLREIVRVLCPGGQFLGSTPNRAVTNPGTCINDRPFNRHHIREYTSPEFESLLASYFGSVRLLGQSAYGGGYLRLLDRIGRVLPRAAVRLHQVRKVACVFFDRLERHGPKPIPSRHQPEVLVALCSSPLARAGSKGAT